MSQFFAKDGKTINEEQLSAGATIDSSMNTKEVVFVDTSVEQYQTLLDNLSSNVEIVLLDGQSDGISQIANALQGRSDIDAIHIVSHGDAGQLQLGDALLTADSMSGEHAEELTAIGNALGEAGDILIYGCNFGEGALGLAATEALAAATGADVAASDDLTGSAALNGDWDLEVVSGTIEADSAITEAGQAAFDGTLDLVITAAGSNADVENTFNSTFAGAGVTTSNFSQIGSSDQFGTFTNDADGLGPSKLPIDSGIVFVTGDVTSAASSSGNTIDGVSGNTGTGISTTSAANASDADLTALSGSNTFDAAGFEFDFESVTNRIGFVFSFASDEYPEFVGTIFNDAFAFFIQGGTDYTTKTNLALVPGTTSGIAVNTINGGTTIGFGANAGSSAAPFEAGNSAFFISNSSQDADGQPAGPYLEYDGLTTLLTVTADITRDTLYSMKIAIADAGDANWDSGVFFQTEGFLSLTSASDNSYSAVNSTTIAGNLITDDTGSDVDITPDGDQVGITVTGINGNAVTDGQSVVLSSGATLIINADGSYTYDPTTSPTLSSLPSNQTATDSFTYEITDASGVTDTATVTIVVEADTDGDLIGDSTDLDDDNDGILDSVELANAPTTGPNIGDSDGDGLADSVDLDSDNDGIPDNIEAQATESYIAPIGDSDQNGLDDAYETTPGSGEGLNPVDTDGSTTDGNGGETLPDYLDVDSDGDGLTDQVESGLAAATNTDDTDGDGLLDDYESGTPNDGFDVNDQLIDGSGNFVLPDTDNDVLNPDGTDANALVNDFDYRDNTAEVSIATNDPNAAEPGDNGQFTVTLTQPSGVDTIVSYSIGGTATNGTDAALLTGTVTIPAGATSAPIDVTVTEDSTVELDETVIVTLTSATNPNATITVGTNNSGTVTIVDPDSAEVTIADAPAVNEGGNLEFTVTLSAPVDVDTEIVYSTSDGTATTGNGDYSAQTSQTLTILAGETTGIITVATTDDSQVELDETLNVTLESVSASGRDVSLGTNTTASGTITNDDTAEVSITNAPAVNEGGNLEFTVTLSEPVEVDTEIVYSTGDGTATTADGDYTAQTSQTLTILAGETTGTITVATTDDGQVESDETLNVTLESVNADGRSVILAASPTASGTITENDSAEVTIADAPAVNEGGNLEFTVTLSAPVDVDTEIVYSTGDDTATTADGDYTPQTSQTLTILAGETTGTITVATTDDGQVESDETLNVTLESVNASGRDVNLAATPTASGTITENDSAEVTIADAPAVNEGGNLEFTVTLSAPVDVDTEIVYSTVDGTATTDDSDYTAQTSQTLTILAGETSGVITVATTDDSQVELDETLNVTLESVNAGGRDVSLAATPTASGTITNDDSAQVSVADAVAVDEGDALSFTVSLTQPVEVDTVITYSTTDGSATAADGDYSPATAQTLTILAGQTSGVITVPTTADNIVEADETVGISLTNVEAGGRSVTLDDATASGEIRNDDFATATVTANQPNAEEPGVGGSATDGQFTVNLSQASDVDTVISYTISGDAVGGSTPGSSDVNGDDYTALTGTVTILAGQFSATIDVPVLDDNLLEDTETVTVTLDAVTSGQAAAITVDPTPATVNIVDRDTAIASIAPTTDGIEPNATGSITNGQFTVSLTQPSDTDTVITYNVTGGDAIEGTDYSTLPGTITILAGETTATIEVPVLNDVTLEDLETVTVTLDSVTSGDTDITVDATPATLNITDQDSALVSVIANDPTAAEGGDNGQFTVSLTQPSDVNTVVTYSIGGDATAGDDYTPLSGTVTILAGETTATIDVPVLDDLLSEPDETVSITLTTVTGDSDIAIDPAQDSAAVTILADTDGDDVPDVDDLDDDNDGILDTVELATAPQSGPNVGDTDGDGIIDSLDLDADNDGILDVVEAGHNRVDSNGDGMVDGPVSNDGVPDAVQDSPNAGTVNYGNPLNSDLDAQPNFQDLDSDNDSLSDVIEGASGGTDADDNGVLDGPDSDGDGIVDSIDPPGNTPDNAFGDQDGYIAPPDADAMAHPDSPDYIDVDSNDDSVNDITGTGNAFLDGDGDGQVDAPADADNDGILDIIDDSDLDGTNDPTDSDPQAFGGLTQPDADGDGILDVDDLDDDNDGILDADEERGDPNRDTDGDGILDRFDLDSDNDGLTDIVESGLTPAEIAALDTDGDGQIDPGNDPAQTFGPNGFADAVETNPESGTPNYGSPVDTDGDTTPDFQDLDADNDGINDVIEGGGTDADGDGLIDGAGVDADGDGLADAVDPTGSAGTPLPVPDTDTDGVQDFRDLDSDNDGLPDLVEAGLDAPAVDLDSDGVVDGPDADGDGIQDPVDGTPTGPGSFGDGNGPTSDNIPDADGDDTPDYLEPDSDNDGIPDRVEAGLPQGPLSPDADGNGVADSPVDTDGDGVADSIDSLPGTFGGFEDTDGDGIANFNDLDDDNDGILDTVELATAPQSGPNIGDTDGDGIIDSLDLDADNDGILDVVEAGHGADDINADGMIDGPVGTDGVPDAVQDSPNAGTVNYGDPANSDLDAQPNFQDLDSDNDSLSDVLEGASGGTDADDNGVLDGPDSDGDGIVDSIDGPGTAFGDEDGYTAPPDADSAADPDSPDYIDVDSNDDGVNDITGTGNAFLDGNGDGQVDAPTDADNDGILDIIDDSDLDGTPDPADPNPQAFGGLAQPDADGDGILDVDDLDDDNDGILDSDEERGDPNRDTDGDGILDRFDLDSDNDGLTDIVESGLTPAEISALDVDGDGQIDPGNDPAQTFGPNGLADAVETNPESGTPNYGSPVDTDGDTTPDFQDLDADNDGINDVIEGGGTDADGDGLIDGAGVDADGDGLADAVDPTGSAGTPLPVPDTDTDGVQDFRDLDSDNDGLPDLVESGLDAPTLDLNGDGVVDGPDTDGDGIQDPVDGTPGTFADGNGPDNANIPDADGDNTPDYLEPDSDNDGIPDRVEAGLPQGPLSPDADGDGVADNPVDTDGDGVPDDIDSLPGSFGGFEDTDGDGIANFNDLDDDNDGILDTVELATAPTTGPNIGDTDGDGIIDSLDLDADNDGINDLVEARHGGEDLDGDGQVDGSVGTDGVADILQDSPNAGTVNYGSPVNSDSDSQPDFQDLDSDNDSLSDLEEGGSGGNDIDGNGVVDGPDSDRDGLQDSVDGTPDAFGDSNSPATPDADSATQPDTPDYIDIDSDNNGVDDIDQAGNTILDDDGDGEIDDLTDLDNDGILDAIDDSDQDGTPDISDPDGQAFGGLGNADTDGDGILNTEDLDDDNDGILDTVEERGDIDRDTDGDGILDRLDLDSDNDGINDVIEARHGQADSDGDGMIDGTSPDFGPNGFFDALETAPESGIATYEPNNGDNDLNPDFQDLDSDNDSLSDLYEGGSGGPDADGNGEIDGVDTDGDGILDAVDGEPTTYGDTPSPATPNADGDDLPDYLDLESDGDGVLDINQASNGELDSDRDGMIDDPTDLDGDGIADVIDDSDLDGTTDANPAETDPQAYGGLPLVDTDGDGIIDVEDLDDDNDGILDSVEQSGDAYRDTDGDGVLDHLDLDADNDGILDVVEANHGQPDTNGDGMVDGTPADFGPNGYLDALEDAPESGIATYDPLNSDNDDNPNFQDLDSDNDSISDLSEGGSGAIDADGNGVADGPDSDGDGIVDSIDGPGTGSGSGFGDEDGYIAPPDGDSGTEPNSPDYIDIDSNGDGLPDIIEAGNGLLDPDGDGVIDDATDVDDDGIPDGLDDSDADGTPDVTDGDAPSFGGQPSPGPDADGDGIINALDLDDDNDGILDTVEEATAPANGDTDGDGIPDRLDLDSDNDGILDVIEAGHGGADADGNGSLDGSPADFGTNGFLNSLETTPDSGIALQDPANSDSDGQPDFQDLDSDNDGLSDLLEGGGLDAGAIDLADNGVIDGPDADKDGIQDSVDGNPTGYGDANNPALPNEDGDAQPDYIDLDSDDDGKNDVSPKLDLDGDGEIDDVTDLDNDGIVDVIDDSDLDRIPDADPAETDPQSFGGLPATDTDGDEIPDSQDLDDDNDGILDVDEGDGDVDTDGDGIADSLDLDSDNDGILDIEEAGHGVVGGNGDSNGDGRIDGPVGDNGLPDAVETAPESGQPLAPPVDTDGDGVGDFRDLDSDNDSINDVIEGGGSDPDGNGQVSSPHTPLVDEDENGILDVVDPGQGGIALPITDTDGDRIADYRELDSDNDGINDVIEAGNGDLDGDGDGQVDGADSDGDGIRDAVDPAAGFGDDGSGQSDNGLSDSNGDGIPDYQQPGSGNPSDGSGTGGDDVLTGGTGDDILNGLSDTDALDGGDGNDIINGGSDSDNAVGGTGNDVVNAGSDTDDVNTGAGDDISNGGSGDDTIDGMGGNDILNGGSGNDTLIGGDGDDLLNGGSGNDLLQGGSGDDLLRGSNGDDRLEGGAGGDTLFGGQGDDIFAYNDVSEFGDTIMDFEIVRDRLDLTAALGGPVSLGDNVQLQQVGPNTLVLADIGGNLQPVATLLQVNAASLSADHFITGAPAQSISSSADTSNGIASGLPTSANADSDFTGDQKPDLLWRNTDSGQTLIWSMDNGQILGGLGLPSPSLDWTAAATADFNNDGRADIFWRNQNSGENVIWEMNGQAIQGVGSVPQLGLEWDLATTGDFNNDGQEDLIWRNRTTGENAVWYLNQGAFISSQAFQSLSPDWSLAASYDFNGDGNEDLIWRNRNHGTNAVWYTDGNFNLLGSDTFAYLPDTTWHIMGNADMNGDGNQDLLWRNSVSGSNVSWYMNSSTILSGGEFSVLPGQEWQMVV